MTTRSIRAGAQLALLGLFLVACSHEASRPLHSSNKRLEPKPLLAATASAPDKPNILLIMVDDLGYLDLSCQGAKDFKTPNIDQLAASN